MSKLISYSLFNGNCERFEKMAYVRGFYWNCRMNNLIFPDWRTHLEVDYPTYFEYAILFDWLVANNNLVLHVNHEENVKLCEGMLWRVKPMFMLDVSHVLCRDTDSITTYREALAVQEWLESGKGSHNMNDNPAHSGLMGGMFGFNTAYLKAAMEVNSFEQLIAGWDLTQRGSDQHLLNQKILPRIKDNLLFVGGRMAHKIPDTYAQDNLPSVNKALWESNLTCRHIGSSGVVEMETIRFFKRFDEYQWKFDVIEKQLPRVFYWHL